MALALCTALFVAAAQHAIAQDAVDLSPTKITYSNTVISAGSAVDFDAGVVNSGDSATETFNIKWLVDGRDVGAYGSHEGVGVGAVYDGNSQFSHTFDAPGTYVITFVVDADDHIAESDESNNSTSVRVVVVEPSESNSAGQSPQFYCITGPGGRCLDNPSQIPSTANLPPAPPEWLTSPATGACVAEFIPGLELLSDLGGVIRWHDSGRKWYVLVTEAMPLQSCAELAAPGVFRPDSAAELEDIRLPARS